MSYTVQYNSVRTLHKINIDLSKEPAVAPQVRNLTYMVTRREKMKRSLWRVQEQILQHQVRLLDHELLTGESARWDDMWNDVIQETSTTISVFIFLLAQL